MNPVINNYLKGKTTKQAGIQSIKIARWLKQAGPVGGWVEKNFAGPNQPVDLSSNPIVQTGQVLKTVNKTKVPQATAPTSMPSTGTPKPILPPSVNKYVTNPINISQQAVKDFSTYDNPIAGTTYAVAHGLANTWDQLPVTTQMAGLSYIPEYAAYGLDAAGVTETAGVPASMLGNTFRTNMMGAGKSFMGRVGGPVLFAGDMYARGLTAAANDTIAHPEDHQVEYNRSANLARQQAIRQGYDPSTPEGKNRISDLTLRNMEGEIVMNMPHTLWSRFNQNLGKNYGWNFYHPGGVEPWVYDDSIDKNRALEMMAMQAQYRREHPEQFPQTEPQELKLEAGPPKKTWWNLPSRMWQSVFGSSQDNTDNSEYAATNAMGQAYYDPSLGFH